MTHSGRSNPFVAKIMRTCISNAAGRTWVGIARRILVFHSTLRWHSIDDEYARRLLSIFEHHINEIGRLNLGRDAGWVLPSGGDAA